MEAFFDSAIPAGPYSAVLHRVDVENAMTHRTRWVAEDMVRQFSERVELLQEIAPKSGPVKEMLRVY